MKYQSLRFNIKTVHITQGTPICQSVHLHAHKKLGYTGNLMISPLPPSLFWNHGLFKKILVFWCVCVCVRGPMAQWRGRLWSGSTQLSLKREWVWISQTVKHSAAKPDFFQLAACLLASPVHPSEQIRRYLNQSSCLHRLHNSSRLTCTTPSWSLWSLSQRYFVLRNLVMCIHGPEICFLREKSYFSHFFIPVTETGFYRYTPAVNWLQFHTGVVSLDRSWIVSLAPAPSAQLLRLFAVVGICWTSA